MLELDTKPYVVMKLATFDASLKKFDLPFAAGYAAKYISRTFRDLYLENRLLKSPGPRDELDIVDPSQVYNDKLTLEDLIFCKVSNERMRDYPGWRLSDNGSDSNS